MLQEKIREHHIDFVGEEARHEEESIAEKICKESCRYCNIDMTPEQRALRKIHPGYNEDDTVSEAEKVRGNREREDHMVSQLLAQAQKSEKILVICGRLHSEAFACQLQAFGHTVEIEDLLNQNWYIEDRQNHMMHNL